MRPSPFRYTRPQSREHALDILHEHGDEARILAGGQSLMPMLTMRLVQPTVVVDINRLPEMGRISTDGDILNIGATARYVDIAAQPDLAATAPLIAKAIPLIAHSGVRNRGTLGGSIALADPAAESPACCLCLDARMVLVSKSRGEREVNAADFFQGIFTTEIESDELLTAIRLPVAPPDRRFSILEIASRHGDFAQAGLCAAADVKEDRIHALRLVFFGVGPVALSAEKAASALEGARVGDSRALSDALAVLGDDLEIEDDPLVPAIVRQRMVRTLLQRTIVELGGVDV
jgi:aerobic carbon-monoxide dehydrogenase medium subunit